MAWNRRKTVVMRGHSIADLTAAGYAEIELPVKNFTPVLMLLGEVRANGDGDLRGRTKQRWKYLVTLWPLKVRQQASSADYADIGRYYYLIESVLSARFCGIYAVYETGSSAGVTLKRADSDGTDDFFVNRIPAGGRLVVLDGDIDPSPNNPFGAEDISFTLLSRSKGGS